MTLDEALGVVARLPMTADLDLRSRRSPDRLPTPHKRSGSRSGRLSDLIVRTGLTMPAVLAMDVAALRAGAVGRRRVTPVKPARKLGARPFGLTGVPFADAALKAKPGQSGFASREHPQIGEGRGAPAGNFAPTGALRRDH